MNQLLKLLFVGGPMAAALSLTALPVHAQSDACQWMFAPAGRPPFKLLRKGPPVEQVLVGDFDGDRIDDVFTTVPEDGFHRWLFSPKGTGEFQRLGLGSPMFGLKFGHFDAERGIDVIDSGNRGNGPEWLMSSGGAASWVGLRPAVADTAFVHVGDFDGDGIADVLTWEPGSVDVQYLIFSGGRGEARRGAVARPPVGVGDFDRDGKADAFFMTGSEANVEWKMAPGGQGPVRSLFRGGPGVTPGFGDFDGDGKTDLFFARPPQSPVTTWMFSRGASEPLQTLGSGPPLNKLRFGDFDGDGRTDVFVSKCD